MRAIIHDGKIAHVGLMSAATLSRGRKQIFKLCVQMARFLIFSSPEVHLVGAVIIDILERYTTVCS